jgi:hypothetical protein
MKNEKELLSRIEMLEERVNYLENLIKTHMSTVSNQMNQNNQMNQMNQSFRVKEYDFEETRTSIIINDEHLSQVLETSMEEQIINIIVEENKKTPFIRMTKDLYMYKNGSGWVHMDDADLMLLIRTIEHKILLLHSTYPTDAEKCFDNNKIIYGLNLVGRFKKIKNKLIDNI